ncbi:hypothetical protein MTP99_002511 [Tenebrio molitor]|jgi:hypothetical protein|nr:hypothetical protein MTP99_002511 [Tenebrio molitor]
MEKKETPFGGTRWGSKRKLMEEPELKKKILVAITEDGPLCEFYTVKKHVKLDDCRKLVKKLFAYAKDTSRGERRAVEVYRSLRVHHEKHLTEIRELMTVPDPPKRKRKRKNADMLLLEEAQQKRHCGSRAE